MGRLPAVSRLLAVGKAIPEPMSPASSAWSGALALWPPRQFVAASPANDIIDKRLPAARGNDANKVYPSGRPICGIDLWASPDAVLTESDK